LRLLVRKEVRTLSYPAKLLVAAAGLLLALAFPLAVYPFLAPTQPVRRSKMMFTKVFGKNVAIGIIALNDPLYDPKHWWRTSEGVREVLGEAIAYMYAIARYTWS